MKRVTVIGAGALGSHLVQALRNEDATIKAIDFDRVEMKNISSQFHFKNVVGKKKTDALASAMLFCWGRKVEVVGHRLTADNVDQLLGGADLLVDCLDNGESRRLVQAYARAHGTPCLHGALAAEGGFGRIVWDEDFVIDDEGAGGTPTCEDGAHLPFLQITASWLAYAAQRFLRDGRKTGFSVSPAGVEKI